MSEWRSYTQDNAQHTVVGDLRILDHIASPQLNNQRHLLVWLPPAYADVTRRFPVLYMHDGDNLFDAYASYAGEWGVDETLTALHDEGLAAIVVGIPNMGDTRFNEYSPYDDTIRERGHGVGDVYLRFIIDTVKPLIDAQFRTLPDVAHTGIAGSSMGGLISLYAFLTHPDVFGLCGAFSPVFWYGEAALYDLTQTPAHGRVYLDIGTVEGEVYANLATREAITESAANDAYRDGVRRLRDGLQQTGYVLHYVEDAGERHHESAWAKRLPDALRFLLAE